MNPNINKSGNNKKVIRGGSWKDVSIFTGKLEDYEYTNQSEAGGFRTVMIISV